MTTAEPSGVLWDPPGPMAAPLGYLEVVLSVSSLGSSLLWPGLPLYTVPIVLHWRGYGVPEEMRQENGTDETE